MFWFNTSENKRAALTLALLSGWMDGPTRTAASSWFHCTHLCFYATHSFKSSSEKMMRGKGPLIFLQLHSASTTYFPLRSVIKPPNWFSCAHCSSISRFTFLLLNASFFHPRVLIRPNHFNFCCTSHIHYVCYPHYFLTTVNSSLYSFGLRL